MLAPILSEVSSSLGCACGLDSLSRLRRTAIVRAVLRLAAGVTQRFALGVHLLQ
jgi:hypothetical protein